LFPQEQIDWGQRAAWGISFSVFVGGILNVTWTSSRKTILIYLGFGLFYWVFDFCKNRHLPINSLHKYIDKCRQERVIFIGTIIVCLLLLVQYAGWVSTPNEFNFHDDYHAQGKRI